MVVGKASAGTFELDLGELSEFRKWKKSIED